MSRLQHYILGKSKGVKNYLCHGKKYTQDAEPRFYWSDKFDVTEIHFIDKATAEQKVQLLREAYREVPTTANFLRSLKVQEWKS